MDWARILACVTGTVDQELLARDEYLAAENRILEARLNRRLRLSDATRGVLGEIGHRLSCRVLADIAPTLGRARSLVGIASSPPASSVARWPGSIRGRPGESILQLLVDEAVGTPATGERVLMATAGELVRTGIAEQRVIVLAAKEVVLALPTDERADAGRELEHIVAIASVETVADGLGIGPLRRTSSRR